MKKGIMIFLLVISVSFLIMGCSAGEENDGSSVADSLENTQKVEVTSLESSDATTISDNNDIEEFVDALKVDEWELEDIPSEASEDKTFKMYQQDTVKLGESENQNDDLNEVATMTTYKDVPNVKFDVESLSLSFKVPDEVAEYLNSKINN
ncbi:hypothetical protein [Oceanobacillus jeddahense]|uniref:Lipoprotein n=1 Tax=Oceanobacillus jeddahense TaxID=1462527 RepID=A0ABY5K1E1_9BACI|nr:hypothetical protein [Oceanobacillus jeddahense]UUI04957.1 hypothetical protein NP439_10100 [Oceanobacillus jeddahense]